MHATMTHRFQLSHLKAARPLAAKRDQLREQIARVEDILHGRAPDAGGMSAIRVLIDGEPLLASIAVADLALAGLVGELAKVDADLLQLGVAVDE